MRWGRELPENVLRRSVVRQKHQGAKLLIRTALISCDIPVTLKERLHFLPRVECWMKYVKLHATDLEKSQGYAYYSSVTDTIR